MRFKRSAGLLVLLKAKQGFILTKTRYYFCSEICMEFKKFVLSAVYYDHLNYHVLRQTVLVFDFRFSENQGA